LWPGYAHAECHTWNCGACENALPKDAATSLLIDNTISNADADTTVASVKLHLHRQPSIMVDAFVEGNDNAFGQKKNLVSVT